MRFRTLPDSWRRSRLRSRLTLGSAATMAAVLAGVAVFVYERAAADLLAANDAGLRSRAEVIVADFRSRGTVLLDVGAALIETDEAFAQILDPAGRIVDASPNVASAPLVSPTLVVDLTAPRLFDTHVPGIDNFARVLAVPVATSNGQFVVLVGSSLQDRADQLNDLARSLSIGLPAALLVASVLAWLLVGAALRPVERMRRDADSIAVSNLTSRLSSGHADELGRLAGTLNAMLDRIAAAFDNERRFVDNASHELRTPLAILRTEIDLALAEPRGVENLTAAIRSASEEVAHLTRLTENLLAISRAHDGRINVEGVHVELRQALDDLARRHRLVAAETHLTVSIDAPDDWVCIDTTRIREALDDIVDNAIRHSPPGGRVHLHAGHDQGVVTFTVSDDGPGFRQDILPRAFEPFLSTHDGGAGLGLAIARLIARAHGGDANIANDATRGARVTLWIRVLD
jgi:two-component system OmpR family sensor kinase